MVAPRTLSAEELESVRLTEAAIDRRPARERAGDTFLKPPEGMVKLYDWKKKALKHGPGTVQQDGVTSDRLIVFGSVEEHVAIVREDHPLLPSLLRAYPHIVMLQHGEEPGKVYTCDVDDQEFPSKRALAIHRAEAHAKAKKQADAKA